MVLKMGFSDKIIDLLTPPRQPANIDGGTHWFVESRTNTVWCGIHSDKRAAFTADASHFNSKWRAWLVKWALHYSKPWLRPLRIRKLWVRTGYK